MYTDIYDNNDTTLQCCEGCDETSSQEDTLSKRDESENGNNDHELIKCEQERDQWKDRYIRVNADLENVRRNLFKDKDQAIKRAQGEIFTYLLSIIDNFERARADLMLVDSDFQNNMTAAIPYKATVEGIHLIYKDFKGFLERFEVREIPFTKHFDPALHEAIATVEEVGTRASGEVVETLQKGYFFKDQVLRPAKVSVVR